VNNLEITFLPNEASSEKGDYYQKVLLTIQFDFPEKISKKKLIEIVGDILPEGFFMHESSSSTFFEKKYDFLGNVVLITLISECELYLERELPILKREVQKRIILFEKRVRFLEG